ncbi:hypothetical protein J8F10_14465 [Gemmata sp. G18]|uniref:Nucleotide pyrophosphohydrolase n=1 Tax=Gemmata palustris TaxID=2822762 RepID=A0ABS5BRY7_9BACT|nr:hypothetical protein [Gemmata palustris]MBP3956481.1 hypothetical protein [Gemmata palustris]
MADTRKTKLKKLRAPDVVDADDILSDLSYWKNLAIEKHQEKESAWLRDRLTGWLARTLGEIEHVEAQLNNQDSELARALAEDERISVSSALYDIVDLMVNCRPNHVPEFLKVEPFNMAKIPRKKKS